MNLRYISDDPVGDSADGASLLSSLSGVEARRGGVKGAGGSEAMEVDVSLGGDGPSSGKPGSQSERIKLSTTDVAVSAIAVEQNSLFFVRVVWIRRNTFVDTSP
jgi:hypothetical protein